MNIEDLKQLREEHDEAYRKGAVINGHLHGECLRYIDEILRLEGSREHLSNLHLEAEERWEHVTLELLAARDALAAARRQMDALRAELDAESSSRSELERHLDLLLKEQDRRMAVHEQDVARLKADLAERERQAKNSSRAANVLLDVVEVLLERKDKA